MAANTYETGDARLSSVDKEAGSAVGTTLGNSFTVPAHPCAHGISASCTSPLLFATLTPARQRSAKGGSHCVARSRFSCQLFPIKLPLPAHAPYLHPVGKRTACGGAAKGKIMVNSPQHGEPIINQPAIKLSRGNCSCVTLINYIPVAKKPRPGFKNLKPVCRVGVLPLQTVAASNENYDAPVGCASDNMFRIYDPYLGRFLSADPVLPDAFNMQSYNRYSYVTNNPLKFTDPTGNLPFFVNFGIGFDTKVQFGSEGSGFFFQFGGFFTDDVGPTANISNIIIVDDPTFFDRPEPVSETALPEDSMPEQTTTGETEAVGLVSTQADGGFAPPNANEEFVFGRFESEIILAKDILRGSLDEFIFIPLREAAEGRIASAACKVVKLCRAAERAGGFVLGKIKDIYRRNKNATKGPLARGRASETRVLDDLGLPKNNTKVSTSEGRAIPDALTGNKSIEIKDCISVSCTKQIRIQTGAARASGRQSVLVTGSNTRVSGPAKEAFDDIIRRPDLGPKGK